MNVDSQNIEPVTDLSLSLGYSNQCMQRRLDSESGAGANAVSTVDVTFLATDPLSELVWSPQKGLSLKCADCSFSEKKDCVSWAAGPSNAVATPYQTSAAVKYCDEGPREDNVIPLSLPYNERGEDAGRDTLAHLPSSSHEYKTGNDDSMDEKNKVFRMPIERASQEDDLMNDKGKEIFFPLLNFQVTEASKSRESNFLSSPDKQLKVVAENDPSPGKPIGGRNDMASVDQPLEMGTVLALEVNSWDDCEAYGTSSFNIEAPGRGDPKSSSLMGKETNDKTKRTYSPSICPREKLESTAENNIQSVISQNAGGTHEVKINLQMKEEILLKDKDSVKHSCMSSRIQKHQRKGKAKALSDVDVNERMSNENDDSHESVESCNSAGLFSTGKKRWSFEHQSISGSKRVKRQFEESPGSSSCLKQDSSFLNWISNMMKGLKSSHDESPSLTLSLTQSTHRREHRVQKLLTCDRTQDPGSKTIGFQSIFQSLYSPRTKPQETTMLNGSYQAGERSNEAELANKACDINAKPIACFRLNDNFCNQLMQSNEKPKDSASMSGEAPVSQLKSMPLSFSASQEDSKMISVEKKTCHNLTTVMENDGRSSNSSHSKSKAFNVDTIDPGLSSKVKPTQYRGDSLSSLWITRLTPKTSGPPQTLDSFTLNRVRALESTCGTMNFPQYQNRICSFNENNVVEIKEHCAEDQPVIAEKELENYVDSTDCFNRGKGPNDQMFISKKNHISPSTSVRNSKATASVFSRRLDTLKQIIPLDGRDNAICATLTCFFCGIIGHHLRDCPQITNAELQDLLKNTHSYDAEEYSSLCLRCFQTGHWAVACPNSSSSEQYKSKYGDSFVKNYILRETQLNMKNEGSQKLLDGKDSQFQATGTHAVKRTDASSSGENKLKRNHIVPLGNVVSWQVSDAPKGIFDAVRSLRLSRMNILKWMSSQMPIPSLHGFFLRLRLGKWEEGLGGTGYYVACITGVQRDGSTGNSRHSVSVSVGGIKCLVESQYISNQDFLEDELLAWWSMISRDGGKIPSENNLRQKVEEKKMLGF
ncbi:uncharacterized protein LOC119997574 isoform X2 [Tripterygium wilfordii]|uniref:uncharacterized protein LOC119997574 isoform X2 n=1 Tax=Tripterygium wilfordii TaxID=458696 RepID=UPI0018F85CC0|nr:uncharacterized protein LOC119997574 isoform X2 [Tripterygium wilfordii]